MSPQAESEKFHSYNFEKADPISIGLSSGLINESDAELIKTFVYEYCASSNICHIVTLQFIRLLVNIRRWSGPFKEATILDLYHIVDGVKTDLSKKGKKFSERSQRDYISRSKQFFTWLSINEIASIPINKISSVKTPSPFNGIKSASDLITPEEVLEIINACKSSRNKAFFTMLYEGGFRVGELGTLKWGDLKFESSGVVLNVLYKTRKSRYLRLIMSKEALAKWKSDYPGEITDDAYVFLNIRGGMFHYSAIARQLERIVKTTTIKKKVNLHLFRHSRVTHLIQQGVSDSVIKLMMWGTVNTRSFSCYSHLSGVDVDREIYKLYGLDETITNKKEKSLEPKICPICKEICGPTSRYFSVCGQLLDETDIEDADRLKKWLMENKDLLTQFLNKSND